MKERRTEEERGGRGAGRRTMELSVAVVRERMLSGKTTRDINGKHGGENARRDRKENLQLVAFTTSSGPTAGP